jgi:hypothetical protein
MMRQIGKQILTIAMWVSLAFAANADSLVSLIVTDPLTGVAMDGYDAVSYFTESDPQPGKPDYEYVWQGVPWYFESAANRDVFMRSPEIYAPQYGGHCLMSLSRGYLSDGKPRLYVIDALKLYFFYSTANRDAYMLSRPEALKAAEANWPKLEAGLIGAPEAASASTPSTTSSEPAIAPADAGANVKTTDSSETPHG